jgi:alpha-ribazole phosphatase
MRLLLVAHAETDWSAQGLFQGHTDIPLNDRGRRQALRLQQHLLQEPFQAVLASDLLRAKETADILARPHGICVQRDARLRELHFGEWEGLTYAEIQERHPNALTSWQETPLLASPPNGECLPDLARRLQDFLGDLSDYPRDGTILLVAHRGALRALLCLLVGLPVERHWDFRLEVASLSEVEIVAGKARIVRLNETLGDLG